MSFRYRLVISPWGQEALYRYMAEHDIPTTHKALAMLLPAAAEDEQLVTRAIELALQLQHARTG